MTAEIERLHSELRRGSADSIPKAIRARRTHKRRPVRSVTCVTVAVTGTWGFAPRLMRRSRRP
jgi:hypothetical protein